MPFCTPLRSGLPPVCNCLIVNGVVKDRVSPCETRSFSVQFAAFCKAKSRLSVFHLPAVSSEIIVNCRVGIYAVTGKRVSLHC